MSEKIAIVVALQREIAPLVRIWQRQGKRVARGIPGDRRDAGATVRCGNVTVWCGGIGAEAARRAAETAVKSEGPTLLISAGVAGGIAAHLKVGDVVRLAVVVDAETKRSFRTRDPEAHGVLVTAGSVLSALDKATLARQYQATAVDMEAAAVAEVAHEAGVPFMAVKAISDAADFEMPPVNQFITAEGKLDLLHLMGWAVLRPGTWRALARLGRNSQKAAEELARELERVLAKVQ